MNNLFLTWNFWGLSWDDSTQTDLTSSLRIIFHQLWIPVSTLLGEIIKTHEEKMIKKEISFFYVSKVSNNFFLSQIILQSMSFICTTTIYCTVVRLLNSQKIKAANKLYYIDYFFIIKTYKRILAILRL